MAIGIGELDEWDQGPTSNETARYLVAHIQGVKADEIDAFVVVAVHHNSGNHLRVISTDLAPEIAHRLLAEEVFSGIESTSFTDEKKPRKTD